MKPGPATPKVVLLSLSALALAACGGEAPKPAEPAAPSAEAPAADDHAGHGAMDDSMKAADASDDANTAETPDGFMFHTDTSKIESIHLPIAAGVTWTATAEDPTQVEITEAADAPMPDGTVHHVVKIKPVKSGVIANVKLEKREAAAGPVTETRTVQVMIH